MNTPFIAMFDVDLFYGDKSTWFWTMIQAVAVAVTLFFLYRQAHGQSRSNVLQSLSALRATWNSNGMVAARLAVCEMWKKNNLVFENLNDFRLNGHVWEIANYFEELGTFVTHGLIDKDICWELYSFQIEGYYRLLGPTIVLYRNEIKDGTILYQFSKLTSTMEEAGVPKGATPMNAAQSQDFVERELASAKALAKTPRNNSH